MRGVGWFLVTRNLLLLAAALALVLVAPRAAAARSASRALSDEGDPLRRAEREA
jgi:hypothetical protein